MGSSGFGVWEFSGLQGQVPGPLITVTMLALTAAAWLVPSPWLLPSCLYLSSLLLATDLNLCSVFLPHHVTESPMAGPACTQGPHWDWESYSLQGSSLNHLYNLSQMNTEAAQDEMLLQVLKWMMQ